MNYEETEAYLASRPVFQPNQVKSGEQIMDLGSLRILLDRLGNPEQYNRYIHVGGTNGKGSTVAFLRAILTESGYRVGTFTSPALFRLTERIQIDGCDIPKEDMARIMTGVVEQAQAMKRKGQTMPSEFEMVFSAALLYFKEQQVDLAILEVGLGGDLDATNVISTPELAVLTPISYDHTELLGDTLEEIAGHKAGIIKPGGQVLSAPQEDGVIEVLQARCQEVGATLHLQETPTERLHYDLEGQAFRLDKQEYHISLLGSYQISNAALAVQGVRLLQKRGYDLISEEAIQYGLERANWPARFQLIHKCPYIIVDGGHNLQGIQVLCQSLEMLFPKKRVRFVTGVLRDKDYAAMMAQVLPIGEQFYTITPPNPRGLSAGELAEYIEKQGAKAVPCEDVYTAVYRAWKDAEETDVICIFGSLYFVGQVEEVVHRIETL